MADGSVRWHLPEHRIRPPRANPSAGEHTRKLAPARARAALFRPPMPHITKLAALVYRANARTPACFPKLSTEFRSLNKSPQPPFSFCSVRFWGARETGTPAGPWSSRYRSLQHSLYFGRRFKTFGGGFARSYQVSYLKDLLRAFSGAKFLILKKKGDGRLCQGF